MLNGTLPWLALLAAPLTVALLWLALASGLAWRIIDTPNERSLHDRPIPRIGGLLLLPVALLCGGLAGGTLWPLLAAVVVLYGLSLVDDVRGLSAKSRLLVQLLAAAGWAASLPPVAGLPAWLVLGVLTLAAAGFANFFNFMDGSNGLAGGMALCGFATLALLAGTTPVGALAWAIAAAAAGFLLFNFHPARVFMGDAGSVPLGFLAVALGVQGWFAGLWPWATPLLAFLPFAVDASVTLSRRALRGEKVWQAHREHYYQRLIRLGWSHRRTALAYYAAMVLCGALAGLAARQPALAAGCLLAGLTLLAVPMRWIDRRWQRQAA